MPAQTTSVFDLPDRLAAKADPALIARDERRFAAIADTLDASIADLVERLEVLRRAPAGGGQQALDRDLEVHRLTARLATLRRFGLDLCLGRMVGARAIAGDAHAPGGADAPGRAETSDAADALEDPDASEDLDASGVVYLGRIGLVDGDGRRLLLDWRSPAAEPFFAATRANPMGLVSRRRYRWGRGRITDYWDETFADDGTPGASLDDESAFIQSLGSARSSRMRDVLATLQADQDAIIRADSRGALVVDGGPGTGKTVVALHRTAYLLYADPRLARRHGGVLFVGPSHPYLDYVADVLPGLGEEGVKMATLRDLVPEGAEAGPEPDPEVAELKARRELVDVIEAAVRTYEEPPTRTLAVETPWADVWLTAADWAQAFDAPELGTTHNAARDEVWAAVLDLLVEQHDLDDEEPATGRGESAQFDELGGQRSGVPAATVRRWLAQHDELRQAFARAWPLLDPAGVVSDLWTVPAHLRRCAPWLTAAEAAALFRTDGRAWTVADLPLLDAARQRIGDPEASARRTRRQAELAAERRERDAVLDHLIAADDSEMLVMSMLRREDARNSLEGDPMREILAPDELAGPFAHIVVDEAQELTDAQWAMLLRRCPARSLTIVGDRAQARLGFAEPWTERLTRIGLPHVEVATLTVNYRTPAEVMAAAEPVIRAALPDANVPTSIRSTGVPVRHDHVAALGGIVAGWLAEHAEGVACVIVAGAGVPAAEAGVPDDARVRVLTPELAKGLEFDLVVLVDPESFGEGIEGAVDRYVAMTRATERLVVLTSS
jgi:hypothetical protein